MLHLFPNNKYVDISHQGMPGAMARPMIGYFP